MRGFEYTMLEGRLKYVRIGHVMHTIGEYVGFVLKYEKSGVIDELTTNLICFGEGISAGDLQRTRLTVLGGAQ